MELKILSASARTVFPAQVMTPEKLATWVYPKTMTLIVPTDLHPPRFAYPTARLNKPETPVFAETKKLTLPTKIATTILVCRRQAEMDAVRLAKLKPVMSAPLLMVRINVSFLAEIALLQTR